MEHTFDEIERYLADELSPDERAAFSRRLDAEPSLREQLEKHRLAHRLLEERALDKLVRRVARQRAAQQPAVSPSEARSAARRWLLPLSVAASLLLIGLWLGYQGLARRYAPTALAEAYFSPYPAGTYRGGPAEAHAFARGLRAYEQGAYERARTWLGQLTPDSARYTEAQLYLGICWLADSESSRALEALAHVRQQQDVRFSPAAQWYQGLALVQQGDWEQAMAALRQMADQPAHPYQPQAFALLKDVRSVWRTWTNP